MPDEGLGLLVPASTQSLMDVSLQPSHHAVLMIRHLEVRGVLAISSPIALVVAATKLLDVADLDVDLERPSLMGVSGISAWRWNTWAFSLYPSGLCARAPRRWHRG